MTEVLKNRGECLAVVGWLIILLCLVYASFYGNGAEVQRLGPLIIAALGVFLCSVFSSESSKSLTVVVVLVASYFVARAYFSPVWDHARRDTILVIVSAAGILSAASLFSNAVARYLFLGALVLIFLSHAGVAVYQGFVDERYAFLRGDRGDQKGVSGLVYHRNYLAGFLEMALPVFLALTLTQKRYWFLWLSLVLGAGTLCYFTNSRSGFMAMSLGAMITSLLWISAKWSSWSRAKKAAVFGGGLVLFAGTAVVAILAFQSILRERGKDGEMNIESDLASRLTYSGAAFEIWQEHPVFGAGSEAFSYLYPSKFSSDANFRWSGDAVMAHNDYLQVLADYGIVGMALLLIFVIFVILRIISSRCSHSVAWVIPAASGAIGAELFRGGFDFNLHLAPSLILFSILVGAIFCHRSCETKSPGLFWRSLAGFYCLALMSIGAFVGGRETLQLPSWIEYEAAARQNRSQESFRMLEDYTAQSPDFRLLRLLGRSYLFESLADPTSEEKLEKAEVTWRKAYLRHPLDGEVLANYARILDEGGHFEEASPLHLAAIKAVGSRENIYGSIYGLAMHLIRRGEEARLDRRAEEALWFFKEASMVLEVSAKKGYIVSKKDIFKRSQAYIDGRVEFLEGARIVPREAVSPSWRDVLN